MPARALPCRNETQEKRAYNGNGKFFRARRCGWEYRVYDRAGNFLSLSRAEDGELRAIKFLLRKTDHE